MQVWLVQSTQQLTGNSVSYNRYLNYRLFYCCLYLDWLYDSIYHKVCNMVDTCLFLFFTTHILALNKLKFILDAWHMHHYHSIIPVKEGQHFLQHQTGSNLSNSNLSHTVTVTFYTLSGKNLRQCLQEDQGSGLFCSLHSGSVSAHFQAQQQQSHKTNCIKLRSNGRTPEKKCMCKMPLVLKLKNIVCLRIIQLIYIHVIYRVQ